MSEIIKDDQDFFNLLIEETYQASENNIAHLACYSPATKSISNLFFIKQVPSYMGAYHKQLKCFRFKGQSGVLDFPQNWGPFSRALFYFDNNEKYFYGVYDSENDPYGLCKLLEYKKVIFFCEGDRLHLSVLIKPIFISLTNASASFHLKK